MLQVDNPGGGSGGNPHPKPRHNHVRKYGLHRLLPEPLVRASTTSSSSSSYDNKMNKSEIISPHSNTEKISSHFHVVSDADDGIRTESSDVHKSDKTVSIMEVDDKDSVEAFLDENSEFLEDYVRKKVHRSVLERWLFQPRGHQSSQQTKIDKVRVTKQRSRSFTPLRKMSSASEFEESGLETPILTTNYDGTPSFLRTSSSSSCSGISFTASPPKVTLTSNNIRKKGHIVNGTPTLLISSEESALEAARDQRLFDLAEDLIRMGSRSRSEESEGQIKSEVPLRLTSGLRDLFPSVDHISVFLKRSSIDHDGVVGDLFTLSKADEEVKVEVKTPGLNRLMTGALMSRSTFRANRKSLGKRPDLKIGAKNVEGVVICPLVDEERSRDALGVIQLASFDPEYEDFFKQRDYMILEKVQRFSSLALTHQRKSSETRLELARSEVFLELARTVFEEQGRIEPTIGSILTNFLTMIDCERCQIILLEENTIFEPGTQPVFKRVFDLERKDLENEDEDLIFEGRFPINAAITGEVATTGRTVNIRDAQNDGRFDDTLDSDAGLRHSSLLCMPIHASSSAQGTPQSAQRNQILGVVSLINKNSSSDKEGKNFFTKNDERFVEAFSLFCGLALQNASDLEAAVRSEARMTVAFDIMAYQATSGEDEARDLSREVVPSSKSFHLGEFHFDYMDMTDLDTYKACIRMFTDFGLLARFKIDYTTFCRWILTVKKNYRNETVPYHNWYHALNVAQTMFAMIRKSGWESHFGQIECLGLLIACLGHDLDHRGTTNAFQLKTKNPLSILYESSTLERHHLNQTLLLLNIPGNKILENLTQTEYADTLAVIERSILATDLALHFKNAKKIHGLAENAAQNSNFVADFENRKLLQHAMMTAADLAAITKPWRVQLHTSKLLAEEFWAQGDLERALEEDAQIAPMMDRDYSLAQAQLGFIDGVCDGVYADMALFSDGMRPLKDGLAVNRAEWARVADEEIEAEERKKILRDRSGSNQGRRGNRNL